jgi:hypothetical protein
MFDTNQRKLIYNAVRYYQMNKVPLDGKLYRECDQVLNQLFPTIHDVSIIKPES